MKPILMRFGEALLVPLLLAAQASLLAYSATTHSPTVLEPPFLASGVYHWQTGRFELYRVNPPLVRMVAALPVMAAGCRTDWSRFSPSPAIRAEYGVGSDFLAANGPDSIRLMTYARWACIPFSLVGAWFAYRWSRELYGAAAGLVTLVLYVFEPNLMAHGELITPDAACASLGIVAGYAFWRWLKRPSWRRAVLSGICLGLAELTKLSWLILFPLWPLMWLAWRSLAPTAARVRGPAGPGPVLAVESPPEDSRAARAGLSTQLAQVAVMLGLAVSVINIGYGFEGTGTALGDFAFLSRALTGHATPGEPGNRFGQTVAGNLPVPLPKSYVEGIDLQKKDFESFPQESFLDGRWRHGGWWYYYLYGLLIKVPCGTLALLALAVICGLLRRRHAAEPRDELVLLTPAVALLALVSSQTEFSIHLRYAYPCLGFFLVLAGRSCFLLTCRPQLAIMTPNLSSQGVVYVAENRERLAAKAFGLVIGGMVTYAVVSAVAVYPHHLAYFNDFVGGPDGGYRHLLGSSFDWGQGMLSARRLMRDNPDCVGYFPAEEWGLARPMHVQLRLPRARELAGAGPCVVRPPALISPNVLMSPKATVLTAERTTETVTIRIPPDCTLRADDGFLRVIRESP